MMWYLLYNFIFTIVVILALPLLPILICFGPRYRDGLAERLGFYSREVLSSLAGSRPVWVHAASVGEVRSAEEEEQLKEGMRFGGRREGEFSHVWSGERKQPFFGFTMVSCAKGDIRQTPDGLKIYGETEQREINLPAGSRGREAEVEELYDAVVKGRPVFHGGRWGAATLEVCLAMLESAKQRKEILLSHQVPSPE